MKVKGEEVMNEQMQRLHKMLIEVYGKEIVDASALKFALDRLELLEGLLSETFSVVDKLSKHL
jgi:hypothetical protein